MKKIKSAPTSDTKDTKDQQIAELTADLQRTRADFENFRKQVEAQREQAKNLATLATVSKLLPLLDDMARAFAAHPTELEPIKKSFDKTLNELEISPLDTAAGVEFNPDLHEAVTMEEGEGDQEVIAETLRPGYTYQGQVLRPAMVKVKRA